MGDSPLLYSPLKRKKREPTEEAPKTPTQDAAQPPMTPWTTFPMTPFLSPGTAKVPTSHDWSSLNVTGSAMCISEHVFAHDPTLSPSFQLSQNSLTHAHGGLSSSQRSSTLSRLPPSSLSQSLSLAHSDNLSPLFDFEPMPGVDDVTHSLLHANKSHLANRMNRSITSAPFNLADIGPISPQTTRLTLPHAQESSQFHMQSQSLFHNDAHSQSQSRKESEFERQRETSSKRNTGFAGDGSAFVSRKSDRLQAPLSPMPGVDAIITAASGFDQIEPVSSGKVLSVNAENGTNKLSTPPSSSSSLISQYYPTSDPSSVTSKADSVLKLEIRANMMLRAQDDKTVTCNCKKSRCLKMYCDCFRMKEYCKVGCHCIDCNNLVQYEASRQSSIKSITDRNPEAFKPRVTEDPKSRSKGHLTGCHCRKSQCLKKYCECFSERIPCMSRCRCVDCKNVAELYANNKQTANSSSSSSSVRGAHNTSSSHNAQSAGIAHVSSTPYKAMPAAELAALSQREKERERQRDRQKENEMDSPPLHTTQRALTTAADVDTPERAPANDNTTTSESFLSPQMRAVRLSSLSHAHTHTHAHNRTDRDNVPHSPPRAHANNVNIPPSPLRLLELASVCEESLCSLREFA